MEFYDAKGHVERFPSISLALEAARAPLSLHIGVGKNSASKKNLFGSVIKSIFSPSLSLSLSNFYLFGFIFGFIFSLFRFIWRS